MRNLEIATDCEELIRSTANPNVYFERLDLLHKVLITLIRFEPFFTYQRPIPSDRMLNICQKEDEYTNRFIERYFYKISEYAQTLKTDKGKRNQFEKFVTSLEPYYFRMNRDNCCHVQELSDKAILEAEKHNDVIIIDKPKSEVICKDYDITSVQGIRMIPYNDFSVMRDLQKCATTLKRNGDILLAVECLKKSNQISDYQTDSSEKLLQKEYLRVLNYIKLLDDDEAIQREQDAIRRRHPEFYDKRISNREKIQQELLQCAKFQCDLVTVDADKNCDICSRFRNTIFSISGKNRKYPKLPDIVVNQTHCCTEHYMSISRYYEELEGL